MNQKTTPDKIHSALSASGAYRWMNCPGSVRLEAEFPEKETSYAEEGTLAHEFVEAALKDITDLGPLRAKPYYQEEMERYASDYKDYVTELMTPDSQLFSETRVDYSAYASNGFGTADTILIGGDTITIIDYKYGKGVQVDAEDNPQLKLYALGAYEQFKAIYDFSSVTMVIYQPRLDHISKKTITLDELLRFGDEVRLKAKATEDPNAPCRCGEWCKFCKAKAVCRARADEAISLAGFTNIAPDTLIEAEIGLYLQKGQIVADWLKDLQDYAFKLLNEGKKINGFKLVEGRSLRKWTNEDDALKYIIDNKLADEALLYERKAISLSQVEKLLGKKTFSQLADFVVKPQGQPTMVAESDKRPEYKINVEKIFS